MTTVLVDSILDKAAALVCAVHDFDAVESQDLLTDLSPEELLAMTVILAAHIDAEEPFRPRVRHSPFLTIAEITVHTAEHFGMQTRDVYRNSQKAHMDATMIVCWIASSLHVPLTDIAERFEIAVFTVKAAIDTVTRDRRLIAAAGIICAAIPADDT